jgi:hypothetical protein
VFSTLDSGVLACQNQPSLSPTESLAPSYTADKSLPDKVSSKVLWSHC